MPTFYDLQLHPWIVRNLKSLKITEPTEIQRNAIPQIMNGKNVVCSALTGSGKTATFVLPLLNELYTNPFGVFAVVLAPTRELAFQIEEQFKSINKTEMNLKTLVVCGGMDTVKQSVLLNRKPHIVIACPGRLSTLLVNCDISMFAHTRYLVIDESDRVLNSSSKDHLTLIFKILPTTVQKLLFSATLTNTIKSCAKDAYIYECAPKYNTVDRLKQYFVFMPFLLRDAYLVKLLEMLKDKSIIVFMPTSKECAKIQYVVDSLGFLCGSLHSDMIQKDRLSTLYDFKTNKIQILIATDVASRGLDIPFVDYVVSFSPPNCVTDYIHRIGRTARAGQKGNSIALVSQHDIQLVMNIEESTKIKMEEFEMNRKDIEEDEDFLKKILMARNEAEMHLDEQPKKKRRKTNE